MVERNGKRRKQEEMEQEEAEEEEGDVEMTNTAWGLQQPDRVVSIEETKLKKRGAP